jgi:selenide,water dikinase
LVGHLVEMTRASKCRIRVKSQSVPILSGAAEAASMGMVPAGTHANRKFFMSWITLDQGIAPEASDLLFDPQTSGGLILGIPSESVGTLVDALIAEGVEIAAEIGEVLGPDEKGHLEIM